MDEMGHSDPALALLIYRQAMRRSDDEKAQLRALVDGTELPLTGTPGQSDDEMDANPDAASAETRPPIGSTKP
jgi:hypothetical protein